MRSKLRAIRDAIKTMTPIEKAIATGIAATAGGGLLYQNYDSMSEFAKRENDPIEDTMNAAEKYLLDPVGTLSPTQAALLAGTALGSGVLANQYLNRESTVTNKSKK